MKDDRKRWHNKDGLEFVSPSPRQNGITSSYGIVESAYDYDDKLYTLTYDEDINKLMINRVGIKSFQIKNSDVEQVFLDVFAKLKEANKYKTKFDHDYVTETKVEVKANQAHVVINNLKIPKPLRNIMFSSSDGGKILHVQTVVTKRLALKNNLDIKATNEWLADLLRKDPKLRVPKTY
jgi:hypothetical protein